jgi:hypothetical protein
MVCTTPCLWRIGQDHTPAHASFDAVVQNVTHTTTAPTKRSDAWSATPAQRRTAPVANPW